MELSTALRQARAAMVAEYAFKQRLERIQWEDEVMKPALNKLAMDAGERMEIPQFVIEAEDSTDENIPFEPEA